MKLCLSRGSSGCGYDMTTRAGAVPGLRAINPDAGCLGDVRLPPPSCARSLCVLHSRTRAAVRMTLAERPFGIEAFVVLPDHLHAVWRMPDGDADFARRWGAIKARFTMSLRGTGEAGRRPGFSPAPHQVPAAYPVVQPGRYAGLKPGLRVGKREVAIWQRRFWEHHIRDQADFDAHVRYCWINPVKHGLVERPEDSPYSLIEIPCGRPSANAAPAKRLARSEMQGSSCRSPLTD
jgi:putative transposase